MKALSKVKIEWSPEFSYAIGLITSDGNLSSDGRHITFTSKDLELAETFKRCLKLENKIGTKARMKEGDKRYFTIGFGDVNFYAFLVSIGLMPAKSKILSRVKVPKDYFWDFFRGYVDGDGTMGSNWHPESRHPQFKLRLYSASEQFLIWIKERVSKLCKVTGGSLQQLPSVYVLTYGKADFHKIFPHMYSNIGAPLLKRKYAIASRIIKM